jgi:hypothetical protein
VEPQIGELVEQVYSGAPAPERRRLLEHLLQPLSLLSLFTVANGVFARIWFRRGWQDLDIRIDDLDMVGTGDVVALVDFVQQVSVETIDQLTQVVAASPVLGASAAAALLVAALVQRVRPLGAGRERTASQK